MDTIRCLDVHW